MISAGRKISFDAFEDRLPVMLNLDRLSVNRFRCAYDFAAEMLSDRLMSETNAENRNAPAKSLDHLH